MTATNTQRRRPLRRAHAGGVLAVGMLSGMSLTACIGPTPAPALEGVDGFPIFERQQAAGDMLPTAFDQMDTSTYDLATSRYSGSYGGDDYYLVRKATPTGGEHCVAVDGATGAFMICGGDGSVALDNGGFEIQMMPAPAPATDGWISISDNIRVRG